MHLPRVDESVGDNQPKHHRILLQPPRLLAALALLVRRFLPAHTGDLGITDKKLAEVWPRVISESPRRRACADPLLARGTAWTRRPPRRICPPSSPCGTSRRFISARSRRFFSAIHLGDHLGEISRRLISARSRRFISAESRRTGAARRAATRRTYSARSEPPRSGTACSPRHR